MLLSLAFVYFSKIGKTEISEELLAYKCIYDLLFVNFPLTVSLSLSLVCPSANLKHCKHIFVEAPLHPLIMC